MYCFESRVNWPASLSALTRNISYTYMYVQGSPSGCVRSEIPGVTQVDNNGHEGNSSSHSLYMLEETWNISLMRNK